MRVILASKVISNKNKQWLLDHLDIGSVWIAASSHKQSSGTSLAGKKSTSGAGEEKFPTSKKVSVVSRKEKNAA